MTAKVNAREPIRCSACLEAGLRPRTLAEVVIVDGGYDVWAPRRRRRRERVDYDQHAGIVLEPPGTSNWRRVGDDEHIRCGRKHRGVAGVVAINAATGAALRRAGAPTDLPRVVFEPPLVAVFPENDPSYREERERELDDDDRELDDGP